MLRVRSILCLVLLLLVSCPLITPAQVSPTITTNSPGMVRLGWKPSPSSNVAGYYLCWGFASGQCTNRLDAGNVVKSSLIGLLAGPTYYFTVVAYSAFGDEAPPSNEVSTSLPAIAPDPTAATLTMPMLSPGPSDPGVSFSFDTSAGFTYEIQATSDFLVWTTIWTTNSLAGGVVSFTEPRQSGPGGRFYRVSTVN
jgi:hypothetical protein